MAAITTDKALNIASRMVLAADQLLVALETFASCKEEKEGAGIDFADAAFVTALEASGIKHADTNKLNGALSNATIILTAMKDGGSIAAFTDDVFQALRAPTTG